MNTKNRESKCALASSSIQSVINKIDSGDIDPLLTQLEGTPFGVYVNAYVVNGVVEPVPLGSSVTELGLNFEVQHWLASKEALIGCFVSMSFSRSIVEVLGKSIALALG